ncbi:MAG: hypothetical protein ACRESS_01420 [Stenotrophobium sp.]
MTEIQALLTRYLDDEDAPALAQACTLAQREPVEITDLLDWLQHYPAEPESIRHALLQLRRALGLRPIPGAVCRPQP